MKTAIILGANAGQADIIRFLQDNGWYVHACGHLQKGLGVEIANEFHLIDILDTEAVSNLAKKINPDIVYSISSDIGIKTATEVSENLIYLILYLPTLLNFSTLSIKYART